MVKIWKYTILLIVVVNSANALSVTEKHITNNKISNTSQNQATDEYRRVQNVYDDYNDDDNEADYRNFIVPETIDVRVDKFVYKNVEYLFVNTWDFNHKQAFWICKLRFHAHLAKVENLKLARFLAEALSETNLVLDSLWLAGRKFSAGSTSTNLTWYWTNDRNVIDTTIDKNIEELIVTTPEVSATDQNCLTFARKNHDNPQFRAITCRALRPIMCERRANDDNSTHSRWIRLGKREYKIFFSQVSYKRASIRCFADNNGANLAVILTYKNCRNLARYLLIGRPSLEGAWIGARYIGNQYAFEPEPYLLPNKSDATGFPPWQNGTISKKYGCVLLDRHKSNTTLFIEARCERKRPYICYRLIPNDTDYYTTDIIIGKYGYRLQLNPKTWTDARDYCKIRYANYSAKLVEIDKKIHVYNLLYVMGENKTAVQHIWVGGRYNTSVNPHIWVWDSSDAPIPMDNSILNWIKNNTFTEYVEEINTCLDMDRENHLVPLHYGTACSYKQPYVCLFTADELRRLKKDEQDARDRHF